MPARTCSAIRAEVKKPSANTTSTKLGTLLHGRENLGHHEVPEENLHQQRDVAKQLDPDIGQPHQPGAVGQGAQRAHQAHRPPWRPPRNSPPRTASSPRRPSSTAGRYGRCRRHSEIPASPSSWQLSRYRLRCCHAARSPSMAALKKNPARADLQRGSVSFKPALLLGVVFHRLVVRRGPGGLGAFAGRQADPGVLRWNRLHEPLVPHLGHVAGLDHVR